MRGVELAPGGRFIAAVPASPAADPDRTGLYVELIGDMNRILAEWCRGAHRRGHRRRGRGPGLDANAGGDPGPLRGGRRAIRRPRARERRALPAREPLLGRRSGHVRPRLRPERHRLGRATLLARVRPRGRGARPRSPRRIPRRARGARRRTPDRFRRDYVEALVICRKEGRERAPRDAGALSVVSGGRSA